MNTTIEAIDARVVSSTAPTAAEAPRLLSLESTVKPNLLVLQPSGSLQQVNSREFQQELERSLEQVTDTVIVDLLRVDSIDADGITALVAGMQRATALGKHLLFQSMNASDRLALETAWAQQQAISMGAWGHTFNSDLEAFLDNFTQG